MKPHEDKRILIIRLSALGDVVNTLPALSSLHKQTPKARVSWVVEEASAPLLEGHPYLDEVIIMPLKKWRSSLPSPAAAWRSLRELRAFFRDLRARAFDVVLDFQGNLKSGILSSQCGALDKVGFDRPDVKELNHLFSTIKVPVPKPEPNRVLRAVALLAGIGLEPRFEEGVVAITEAHRAEATECEREGRALLGMGARSPLVLMHPGTSNFARFKRWPTASFGQLASLLKKTLNACVLVTGGPGEEALCEEVVAASDNSALRCPRLSGVKAFAALLKRAKLVVGADTGPVHLAACLGVSTVAVYGPKDPAIYAPYGPSTRFVAARVPCAPCDKRTCNDVVCMRSISPNEVLQASLELVDPVLAKRLQDEAKAAFKAAQAEERKAAHAAELAARKAARQKAKGPAPKAPPAKAALQVRSTGGPSPAAKHPPKHDHARPRGHERKRPRHTGPPPKPPFKAKAKASAKPPAKPVAKPAPKPVAKPAPKPVAKPVHKPAPKPVHKPAPKPASKPASKPPAKPRKR